jgi:Flp pilus assembly protein protease CpaA
MAIEHQINRRQFMVTTSVVGGAFVLGFILPPRQVKAATIAEKPWNSPTTGGYRSECLADHRHRR